MSMKNYCLLFPGQASQYVGMAKSFLEADEGKILGQQVDDALGFSLSKLMLEGPLADLTKTAYAQAAILFHSYLSFKKIKDIKIVAALGHSLGEYSALTCAETLSLNDAVKIVHLRGKLMQEACPLGNGAMAAILGLDFQIIENALLPFKDENKEDYVTIANYNSPLQTVISGTSFGVENAIKLLKGLGAKKSIILPVSAPFHCALMRPAQDKLALHLRDLEFKDPKFPIISTSTTKILSKASEIKEALFWQMVSPVYFMQSIKLSKQKYFIELGPGQVLSGLVKRIDDNLLAQNIDNLDDIKQILSIN